MALIEGDDIMTNEYLTLKESMEEVKIYSESSHFDRKLMKEKGTKNLYLYEFYEYVSFGGLDEIYETFTLVKNEKDADTLNMEKDIRRSPYIRVNPNYSIIKG
jgi:hypothetical protein